MKPIIRKVTLREILPEIRQANPEFAKILSDLNPPPEYSLYHATYPYGHRSVRGGRFQMQNKQGNFVPLSDSSIDEKIREDLIYNAESNPVTLVLKNTLEICLEFSTHTIPWTVIPTGAIFSTGAVLNIDRNYQPAFIWTIYAGVRSIFSLSKLSVANKFEKLQRHFKISGNLPTNFADHGKLFSELVNSPEFGEKWQTKVLYFGKKWFENLDDPAKKDFVLYLYKRAWYGTSYWTFEFVHHLIFSLIQQKQNLNPDPMLADTVKHILTISMGACPGFSAATDDQLAPVSQLEKIITDIYQLDKYAPIIMVPTYFSMYHKSPPVYYFLSYPTMFDFAPKSRALATKRNNLAYIRHILNKSIKEIKLDELNLSHAPIGDIPFLAQYDFFHDRPLNAEGIRDTHEMLAEDPIFMQQMQKYKGKLFPADSPLLRGCVRISNVKDV